MLIDDVLICPITLPFSVSFDHALSRETAAQNVVVAVTADDGRLTGFGEGAPRPYVTGETQASAVERIAGFVRHPAFPWRLNGVESIVEMIDALAAPGPAHAALCALETALFDLVGKAVARSVVDLLPGDHRVDTIRYGAPIPLADPGRTRRLCERALAMGMRTVKVKLGGDIDANTRAMADVAHVFGSSYTLKVDVNGIWDRDVADAHLPVLARHNVRVVEQPLAAGHPHLPAYARRLKALGIRCMADESACSAGDIAHIRQTGSFDMINVRLSKCGGFLTTLGFIREIRRSGLVYQIGCHLGESGLLSAAGRALSLLSGDALFFDGSYDAFLLAENVTTEHVTFGPGGEARALDGPGLGVVVDERKLSALSDQGRVIRLHR